MTRLVELAAAAERHDNRGDASTVFNQAALLASDLGLPDLARQWCHRHANAYLGACPLGGMDAIRSLEPLVNLARLHIRAGRGDEARRLLLILREIVTSGASAALDDITVPADLTVTDVDRQEVSQWLWRVVITDGTRALTAAGRWQQALTHVERHHGIGERMLDGRQVAVIARATAGDDKGAQQFLANTAPGEPWENAVTACLTALCRPSAAGCTDAHVTLVDRCRQLDVRPNLIVFHTRLMLSIIDAAGSGHRGAKAWAAAMIDRIVKTGDGYSARDVLSCDSSVPLLTRRQMRELGQITATCALGAGSMPAEFQTDVSMALDISEAVINRTLIYEQ